MKKFMIVAVVAAALASCQSGSKKNVEVVEADPVVAEVPQTVTPDSVGYIVKVGDMAPDFEMD